jgi:hypothetical protein
MKKTAKTTIETVVEVAKVKGRKTNLESIRQKRLAERAAKGEVKRGRPILSTSARQARIAELAAKREVGMLKKGRPIQVDSKRQLRLANVGTAKRGRPAKVKNDIVELVKG